MKERTALLLCGTIVGLALVAGLLIGGLVLALSDDDAPPQAEVVEGILPGPGPTLGASLTAAPCSATSPQGQTYDPCAGTVAWWVPAYWQPLKAVPYFTKWTTANPGEWAALDAWRRDGLHSAMPPTRTSFGRVVGSIISQCKDWVNVPADCAVP